jgi:hypothetical protein
MAFGGFSHVLVTVGEDWAVRVWDVASGVEPRRVYAAAIETEQLMLGDDDHLVMHRPPSSSERTESVIGCRAELPMQQRCRYP